MPESDNLALAESILCRFRDRTKTFSEDPSKWSDADKILWNEALQTLDMADSCLHGARMRNLERRSKLQSEVITTYEEDARIQALQATVSHTRQCGEYLRNYRPIAFE